MADTEKTDDQSKKQATPPDPPQDDPARDDEDEEEVKRTPEEEAAALEESHARKAEANSLFSSGDIHNALAAYEDALLPLPKSAHYARAVVHSNISACHLRIEQPKEAAAAATASLDELSALEAILDSGEQPRPEPEGGEEGAVEGEIVSSGAERAAPAPGPAPGADPRKDMARIRTKSLLRRARAHATTHPPTWSSLSSAQSDYRTLDALPPGSLGPADSRTVRSMLRDLEPRAKEAQEREMGEMWGKLKELGDGILRPFGLSTGNFQMVKDEATGGYSMNFKQNGDQ